MDHLPTCLRRARTLTLPQAKATVPRAMVVEDASRRHLCHRAKVSRTFVRRQGLMHLHHILAQVLVLEERVLRHLRLSLTSAILLHLSRKEDDLNNHKTDHLCQTLIILPEDLRGLSRGQREFKVYLRRIARDNRAHGLLLVQEDMAACQTPILDPLQTKCKSRPT